MSAFGREKARKVLITFGKIWDYHGASDEEDALDDLEACVVPSNAQQKLTRIEALLTGAEFAEYEEAGPTYVQVDSVRAILRGDA